MRPLAQLFSISFVEFTQIVVLGLQGAKRYFATANSMGDGIQLFVPHTPLAADTYCVAHNLMGIITGEICVDGLGAGACLQASSRRPPDLFLGI